MRSPLFDIFDPYGELNNQQFYDQEDPLAPPRKRDPTIADLMPEEEKQSLLRNAANMGASGVSGLGWLLDTPGAVIRGLASGGPSKALSALWESSGDRVEGRELLRQYGLVGDEDNWQNWTAGFAGEVLLDPLTYLNPLAVLGRGAYGPGGRAAARAGLLENIDLIAKADNKGTRQFMRENTVGQLLGKDLIGKDAFTRLSNAARGKGLNVDDIMNEKLSGIAELRVPGTERGVLFSGGKVGDAIAGGLDNFGDFLQTNKYTAPIANRAVAAFDPNVLEQIDPEKQWMAREAVAGTRSRQRANLEELTFQTRTARTAAVPAGVPKDLATFDSRRIQNAIADSIEAGLDPARMSRLRDQEALAVIESVPEWAEFRRYTEDKLASEMQARAKLGLDTPIAKSVEGTSFLPSQVVRFAREQPVNIPGRDGRRVSAYERSQNVFATDDLVGRGRQDYLDLDRRRETLRELMRNPAAGNSTGRAFQERLIAAGDTDLPALIDEAFGSIGMAAPYSNIRTADGATMQSLRDALADSTVVNRTELTKQLADLEKTAAAQKVQLGDLLRQSDMQFSSEGMGLFDNDVVSDLQRYLGGGARAQANADLLGRVLQSKASTTPFDQVAGGGAVNLLKGAQSLGFDKSRLQPMLEARMPGADVAGLSITQKELDALKVLAPSVPKPDGPRARFYNSFTSAFKIGALANPAYHVRNAYSGLTSTLTGGGVSPFGAALDAYAGFQAGRGNYGPLADRLAKAPAYRHFSSKQEIIDDFLIQSGRNDLGQGLVGESDAVLGSPALMPGTATERPITFYDPKRSLSDWATVRGVDFQDTLAGSRSAPRETLNPLIQLHERAGKRVEDGLRLGTYIGQIRQGASADMAAQQVFKTQVNYAPEAYTNFERQLKKYIPFYSYSRGIAPLVAENLLQRPGGLQGQIIRGMSNLSRPGEDRFVPEHLRSSAAVALPGEYGKDGNLQRYVTNIDVPFEGLVNLVSPGIGNTAVEQISDGVQKTAMNVMGMVNPLIKAPLEMMFNRQLYSGREMSDLYSMLEQDIGPLGRPLEQIAVNLPMGSKINALVRTARDKRLSPAERATKLAINNLLGVKVTDVDQKRAGEQAARKTLTDLLSSTPGVRSYENVTVPEDVLRAMPEEQRKRYLVYKVLQSEASKRARQRKAAEADPMDILLNR